MSTVTSKGQVTIPKAVRDLLGIQAGTEIEFRLSKSGEVIVERADKKRPPSRIAAFRGHAGPGMSTDEIMALLRGEP